MPVMDVDVLNLLSEPVVMNMDFGLVRFTSAARDMTYSRSYSGGKHSGRTREWNLGLL